MTRLTVGALASTAVLLTTILASAPAAAQLQAQTAWCGNLTHKFSLTMQIGGCTALIDSGKLPDKPLAWSHTNRGMAYMIMGDFDKALADLNKAVDLDSTYAPALVDRGSAYDNKNDHAHALADFDAAIKLDPKSADALTGRCAARAETGNDLEQALADCNQSLQIRGKDAGTLNSRGFAYLRLGKLDEAIADYNVALKINPRLASALWGRGLAKQKKGDSAGGQIDMASANLVQSDIADEFVGYGVK